MAPCGWCAMPFYFRRLKTSKLFEKQLREINDGARSDSGSVLISATDIKSSLPVVGARLQPFGTWVNCHVRKKVSLFFFFLRLEQRLGSNVSLTDAMSALKLVLWHQVSRRGCSFTAEVMFLSLESKDWCPLSILQVPYCNTSILVLPFEVWCIFIHVDHPYW